MHARSGPRLAWLATLGATAVSTYALDALRRRRASRCWRAVRSAASRTARCSPSSRSPTSPGRRPAGQTSPPTGACSSARARARTPCPRRLRPHRRRSGRVRRLAAGAGYVLTEIVKEAPYYSGAFGAVLVTDSVSADDALVFLAGANLGAALYEYWLARATAPCSRAGAAPPSRRQRPARASGRAGRGVPPPPGHPRSSSCPHAARRRGAGRPTAPRRACRGRWRSSRRRGRRPRGRPGPVARDLDPEAVLAEPQVVAGAEAVRGARVEPRAERQDDRVRADRSVARWRRRRARGPAQRITICSSPRPHSVSSKTREPAGGGSLRRRTTPARSSSRRRWRARWGPRWGAPLRRSVWRLGPRSSSRTTSSAQRSPTRSRPYAIAQPSPYVRIVDHRPDRSIQSCRGQHKRYISRTSCYASDSWRSTSDDSVNDPREVTPCPNARRSTPGPGP